MMYHIDLKDPSLPDIPGIISKVDSNDIHLSYREEYLTHKFLYYYVFNDTLQLSFDFFEICESFKNTYGRIEVNKGLIPFFSEKGYAPFDCTIIGNIFKIPNFLTLHVDRKSFTVKYKLDEISLDCSKDTDIIINSIKKVFDPERKNVILFSGGFDSTLIAYLGKKYFKEYNIELATGYYSDFSFEPAKIDQKYSQIVADALGFPFVMYSKEIKKITKIEFENIVYKQPNTSHFSFIFDCINNAYKEGKVNFISGQQADSVLNFGSTAFFRLHGLKIEAGGELLGRIIWGLPTPVSSRIFKLLNRAISLKYSQLSLLVGDRKFPVIKNEGLYNSAAQLYEGFLNKMENRYIEKSNLLFYVLTFLSGSDASGIVNNVTSTGHILPFDDKSLIWHFICKRNTFQDLWIPKRPVMEILKEDKKIWKILMSRPNTPGLSFTLIFDAVNETLHLEEEFNRMKKDLDLEETEFGFHSYHLMLCLKRIYGKII